MFRERMPGTKEPENRKKAKRSLIFTFKILHVTRCIIIAPRNVQNLNNAIESGNGNILKNDDVIIEAYG